MYDLMCIDVFHQPQIVYRVVLPALTDCSSDGIKQDRHIYVCRCV